MLKGKRYKIIIQGCRTNQYEGEAIAAALEKEGAIPSDVSPDIVVIVTCTITAVADRKCRKLIRRAKRENPSAAVVACGCCIQKMDEAERLTLGIDIAAGNRLKDKIPGLLSCWFKDREILSELDPDILRSSLWDNLKLDRPRLHTRAFLKIQDGCDHFCSYCIVPYVRGASVSRDSGEILAEALRIAASGCAEIVLTGIHIGLYRDLGELVRRIGSISGIKRIRFGSLEPFAVDEDLLAALASVETFCPHLHLPLQSGDDGVLEQMRRGYTSSGFAKIVGLARKKLGGKLHISTDLMVGFPGEDEKAFENSLRFAKEMGFGKIHVFPYSPREGTMAAQFRRPPLKEVKERVSRALHLAAALHKNYASAWIGREVSVLVEEINRGVIKGLTPHFIRVITADSGDVTPGTEISVTPGKYVKEALASNNLCHSLLDMEKSGEFL